MNNPSIYPIADHSHKHNNWRSSHHHYPLPVFQIENQPSLFFYLRFEFQLIALARHRLLHRIPIDENGSET
ncbi:hypothetical protein L2E82_44882 [Cichorium intybus]|uniref:Uncharacterized protein n=2 Tax=Cichorium intybus TaxID=13427 RepID=A0ACB8YWW7_CICIN|nr:hypothetical protein L2E82_47854 [Cichorium intybus]KAI3700260.1 hypothetical protein L2E82_44882 [Cichorium intybus]